MESRIALIAGAALAGLAALPAGAGTLDKVKARGQLVCGANPGLAGFGLPDDQGVYRGLDVDKCRAIAAAIFNDPNKVKYIAINAKDRPTILASGEIDVLMRNTTWTMSRELGGMLSKPDEHIVLPEIISKEPLGPAVRKDDIQWFEVVQWTHYAVVTAEELGVTQANVDEMLKSPNPNIRRLLGVEGDFGQTMGLTNDWAYRIIKAIGNYGESFERNVGMGSAIKIKRGLNALWNKGGLQYAPPIR
jgi:ABC-type amino acid transport substrate-binding protein